MFSTVTGLAVRRERGGPMELLETGYFSAAEGFLGDHSGHKERRQVTVLSLEQWREACAELEPSSILPWEYRRANVCISNIRFHEKLVGRRLALGRNVILRINGETKPCYRMDEVHPGLQAALAKDWRGGVTCTVISDGMTRLDDIAVLF